MISDIYKATVLNELTLFKRKTLDYFPSYAPTQKEVLDLIDLYWVDKFKDGDQNLSGWKRAFYNIVQNPTLVNSKLIDVDTKDVQVKAEDGQSYYTAWVFQRDLKYYMKDKQVGVLLNDIVYNLPKYGSVVLKKVGEDIHLVPLRNLAWDVDVSTLEESSFVTEIHEYTKYNLRRQKWDKAAIEDAIAKAEGDKICVYERFGDMPFTDNNYHIISKEGVLLFAGKFDSIHDLYRKLDWDKIPGRLLGRGTVEKLFEAQIQANRVENYKTEGLHWSSKIIFQTRDTTVNKNMMTETENGDVINAMSEITAIQNQEKNLAAYNSAEQRWDTLVRNLTFSYAELSGERPPAGTPLGTSILQTQQATGFFDLKREELGLFLKEMFFDWVIPEFRKKSNMEHKLMLGNFDESEVQKIRGVFANIRSNEAIMDYVVKNKEIPDEQTIRLIKSIKAEEVKRQKELVIPANFYDNLKYKIDIVITNEQIDVAARLTTLQSVLQLLSTNPAILENPRTKRVFFQLLDLSGINPVDLGLDDEPEGISEAIGTLQRGGSIAAPTQAPAQVGRQAVQV